MRALMAVTFTIVLVGQRPAQDDEAGVEAPVNSA
jgi:hypothetical protein